MADADGWLAVAAIHNVVDSAAYRGCVFGLPHDMIEPATNAPDQC